MPQTSTMTRYTGWHRPNENEQWSPVCSADTADDCWTLLLDAKQGGDKMVLASSDNPNQPQRPFRKRLF